MSHVRTKVAELLHEGTHSRDSILAQFEGQERTWAEKEFKTMLRDKMRGYSVKFTEPHDGLGMVEVFRIRPRRKRVASMKIPAQDMTELDRKGRAFVEMVARVDSGESLPRL